jgi:hypothetical protein
VTPTLFHPIHPITDSTSSTQRRTYDTNPAIYHFARGYPQTPPGTSLTLQDEDRRQSSEDTAIAHTPMMGTFVFRW